MPKVGKGPATLQSRPFRTGGKRAELDLVVADAEMGCGRPGERAITRDLSFCAADRNISRVPAMEKGIVETGLYVIRYELDRDTVLIKKQLALPYLEAMHRDGEHLIEGGPARLLGCGFVGGAIGVVNEVNHGMSQRQSVKRHSDTEHRAQIHNRAHAVHMH